MQRRQEGATFHRPLVIMIMSLTACLSASARVGYEETASGTNLILWLKLESQEPIHLSLLKGEK